jgi:hypothetical protein
MVIYKIVCNDANVKEIFVGATTGFIQKKSHHKINCMNPDSPYYNLHFHQYIVENGGWNNFSMVELEKYPCNTKSEANTRVKYYYDILTGHKKQTINSSKMENKKPRIDKDKKEQFDKNKKKSTVRSLKPKKNDRQPNITVDVSTTDIDINEPITAEAAAETEPIITTDVSTTDIDINEPITAEAAAETEPIITVDVSTQTQIPINDLPTPVANLLPPENSPFNIMYLMNEINLLKHQNMMFQSNLQNLELKTQNMILQAKIQHLKMNARRRRRRSIRKG